MENPLASAFRSIFDGEDGAFREILFRTSFGEDLDRTELQFYESCRTLRNGRNCREFEREEALFNKLVLDKSINGKMLLLTAPRGTGKTTFLHYFFSHFWKTRESRILRTGYSATEVLFASLVRGADETHVDELWRTVKKDIRSRFRNIDSENQYAMWDNEYCWEEEKHQHAAGQLTNDEYRGRVVVNNPSTDFVFCREALRYLSHSRRGLLLILVVDDIDHLTPNAIFKIAQDLRVIAHETGVHVVMPMRPETQRHLVLRGVAAGDHADEIELGIALESSVINRRAKYARQKVSEGECEAFEIVRIGGAVGDGVCFLQIAPSDAQRRMEALVSGGLLRNQESLKYAWGVLRSVAGRSIRGVLRMRRRLAKSLDYYRGIAHADRLQLSNYEIIKGVLCAGGDEFFGSQHDCDISDVYALGRTGIADVRLIGGHLLLQLLKKGITSEQQIKQVLWKFEIPSDWVDNLIENFASAGIIHCLSSSIEIEEGIVSAYLELVEHPAYIDSISWRICSSIPANEQSRMLREVLATSSELGYRADNSSLDHRLSLAMIFVSTLGRIWKRLKGAVGSTGKKWKRPLHGLASPETLIRRAYCRRLEFDAVRNAVVNKSLLLRFCPNRGQD